MLRIPWKDHISNEEVLIWKKASYMLRLGKRQLRFLGHILRKVGWENLKLTGLIEIKSDRRKRRVTYITSLYDRMAAEGKVIRQILLGASKG